MDDENGQQDPSKRERYNTTYLVSQIQTEQNRNKKIGLAITAVVVVVALYVMFIHKPAAEEGSPTTPTASAPAQH